MHLLHAIVLFAIVLGIMVLVHELGHFLMGKLCGVRVDTFSIGFGPRLLGVKYGETDYRISALPLGGYVKFAGELPGTSDTSQPLDPGEFNAHPRWQRVLIALAGPFANFILSFVLLTMVGLYHYQVPAYLSGPAVVDYVPQNSPTAKAGLSAGDTIVKFAEDNNPNWDQILNDCLLNLNRDVAFSFSHQGQVLSGTLHVIPSGNNSLNSDPLDMAAMGLIPQEQTTPLGVAEVDAGTPADRAGLKAGDLIVTVDNFAPHSVTALLAYLRDRNGAPAVLKVSRNGQEVTLFAQPQQIPVPGGTMQYRLGFLYPPAPVAIKRLPLAEAVQQSIKDNLQSSTMVFRILKGMFTRHVAVSSLSGPVGMAQQIDLASRYGFWVLLGLMSMISLQLGIFNLLPVPILDGGMILFLAIESIMRRDVNEQVKERIYQFAFVCIILFAAFVMFNDVSKLHIGH